jgi:enoyl-CoA hydratase/carnithine racemase
MGESDNDDLCLAGVEAGVCTLTFNNPERRNGWSSDMERRFWVFDADEAKELGLVSRVCDPETVLAEAQAYAADLAANCSPRSMAAMRSQVYDDLSRGYDEALARSVTAMQAFTGDADFAEGVASFAERRPAKFPALDAGFSFDAEAEPQA